MSEVTIKPGALAAAFKREGSKMARVFSQAAMGSARRFAALVADAYDSEGITYQGILKNSCKAVRRGKGAAMVVDAPHAGIIELGARPHPVSREGVEAIARWVFTKLHAPAGPARKVYDHLAGKYKVTKVKDTRQQIKVLREGPVREQFEGPTKRGVVRTGPGSYKAGYDEESLRIAYAIAQTIKVKGQKPHYVVRRHLPYASQFYAQEVERMIRSAA